MLALNDNEISWLAGPVLEYLAEQPRLSIWTSELTIKHEISIVLDFLSSVRFQADKFYELPPTY